MSNKNNTIHQKGDRTVKFIEGTVTYKSVIIIQKKIKFIIELEKSQ